MTWNVVTLSFGDEKYKKGQKFLTGRCKLSGVNHITYDENDFYSSEIYTENKEWFSKDNGYGWFAWKPYFILKSMEQLEEGDKILWIDSLDIFHPDIFSYADGLMDNDPCLLPLGNSRNGDYTKKECFVRMDCDEEAYWESNQLEAGFTFWRVCDRSKSILSEWLKWCLDPKANGDDPE